MIDGPALPKSHGKGKNEVGHATTLVLASAVPFLNGPLAVGKAVGWTRTVMVLTVGVGLRNPSQTAVPFPTPNPFTAPGPRSPLPRAPPPLHLLPSPPL